MNKYYKYKTKYSIIKKNYFGGSSVSADPSASTDKIVSPDPSPEQIVSASTDPNVRRDFDLIVKSNYSSIFNLLSTMDYGMVNPSVANICYWDDFNPITTHHMYIIKKIIETIKTNILGLNIINLYLIPNLTKRSDNNILEIVKIVSKELDEYYKSNSIPDVKIFIHPIKFEQMIEWGIYDFNSPEQSNTYLKLELFSKLYLLNPAQTYLVTSQSQAYYLFEGLEPNTIHLISKYNFICLVKELANTFKLNLSRLFDANKEKFISKLQIFSDLSLVKYNRKKLDFYYQDEIKINGELDYRTMQMTIEDLGQNPQLGKIIIIELELTSLHTEMEMSKSSLQFVSKSLSPQVLEYIWKKQMYLT